MRTIVPTITSQSHHEPCAIPAPDGVDPDELAGAVLADGWTRYVAELAEARQPGGGAAFLAVDRVVERVAEPHMRVIVSLAISSKIAYVVGNLNGPAPQQCPEFHAYVTLAEAERGLGSEIRSEAWFARLAEIEPSGDGAL